MIERRIAVVDEKVLQAVRLRQEGRSWRECGEVVGMDASNLRKAAVARGYKDSPPENRRAYFAEQFGRIADEANRQLLERLARGEPLKPKELAVVSGIAADKISMADGWGRAGSGGSEGWLQALSRAMEGMQLDMKITPVSAPPKTIDITPDTAHRVAAVVPKREGENG